MFSNAYRVASEFTKPVVLSRLTVGGKCSASIASYVILNADGWIATAHHMVELISKATHDEVQTQTRDASAVAIRADNSLNEKERRANLQSLGKSDKNDTARASAWWGHDHLSIKNGEFHSLPAVDLAIAQLENFDPTSVKHYPKIKDPSKDFEPGRSLCKLGYPFHQIAPTYDSAKEAFSFAGGLPRFPIEGIFTREAQVVVTNGHQPPYKLAFVETSSPGLKGQSGGPTFDAEGALWAIQVQTASYPLGFSQAGQPEQHLNAGLGVHAATLIGFLSEIGVKFDLSDH